MFCFQDAVSINRVGGVEMVMMYVLTIMKHRRAGEKRYVNKQMAR